LKVLYLHNSALEASVKENLEKWFPDAEIYY
jgi:hypothetical protein